MSELNHLLRESNDRATALFEELAEAQTQRHRDSISSSTIGSPTSRLSPAPDASLQIRAAAAADVERRYETKLSDMRARLASIERERTESEEEWSRTLAQRAREVERLKGELSAREGIQSAQDERGERASVEREALQRELKSIREERQGLARELAGAKAQLEQAKEAEVSRSFLGVILELGVIFRVLINSMYRMTPVPSRRRCLKSLPL